MLILPPSQISQNAKSSHSSEHDPLHPPSEYGVRGGWGGREGGGGDDGGQGHQELEGVHIIYLLSNSLYCYTEDTVKQLVQKLYGEFRLAALCLW